MALYSGRLLLIQIKAVVRQPQKWRMALSSKHAFDLLGVAGIVSIILGLSRLAYIVFFY